MVFYHFVFIIFNNFLLNFSASKRKNDYLIFLLIYLLTKYVEKNFLYSSDSNIFMLIIYLSCELIQRKKIYNYLFV